MYHLARRKFISSLGLGAGSWLLAPMLGQILRPALGAVTTKNRVIFFLDRIGIHSSMRPTGTGGLSMGGYTALEAVKAQVSVVQHMYNPFSHHLHGNKWFLTAADSATGGEEEGAPPGRTIDRAIAAKIGTDTPISSINQDVWYDKKAATSSADGANAPYASEKDPVATFAKIFGNTNVGNDDAAQAAFAEGLRRKKSVLDFVVSDLKKASGRLAGPEKAQLEQYLTSLREIESNLAGLGKAKASCQNPVSPTAAEMDGNYGNPARAKAVADMLVQALSCGFTRVVTMVNNSNKLPFLGSWTKDNGEVMYPGAHQMWHGQGTDAHHRAYYNHSAETMAHMRKRLEALPDGAGSLADSTLIVFINSSGGNHHGGQFDYVVMTIGSLGGKLKTGALIQLPNTPVVSNDPRITMVTPADAGSKPKPGKDAPARSIADFYVSVAHAVGAELNTFGDPRINKGVLTEMFT